MKIRIKILISLLFIMEVTPCFAQQPESIDTIKIQPKPDVSINPQINTELPPPSFYSTYDKTIEATPPNTIEVIQPDFSSHFETKNIFEPFSPYSYSYLNSLEGHTYQGLQSTFEITDFLTTNVNTFLSSAYYGESHPYRYINGSMYMNLKLRVLDRVKLVGEGQVSIREGFDPKLPASIGGANFYGVGIEVKVAKRIGIGVGVRNYYYRGSWTKRTYAAPVGW